MMRRVVTVVAVLALLWAGWWGAMSYLAASAVRDWFATQAMFGRMAGLDRLVVAGFPHRVALTLEGPYLADPFRGLSWAASGLQISARGYPPLRLAAELPQRQTVRLPGGAVVELRADAARAELALGGLDLRLDRAWLSGNGLVLAGAGGGAVDALRLDVLADPDTPARYRLLLRLDGLRGQAAAGPLPSEAELLTLAGAVALSAPIDRHFGTRPEPPVLERIDVDALRLVWGRVELDAAGSLRPDADGRTEGQIAVRLRHWRDLLDAAVALEALDAEIALTWARALELIAAESPQAAAEDVLETTLSFRAGRMRIGPLPIGPAPLLRLPH